MKAQAVCVLLLTATSVAWSDDVDRRQAVIEEEARFRQFETDLAKLLAPKLDQYTYKSATLRTAVTATGRMDWCTGSCFGAADGK